MNTSEGLAAAKWSRKDYKHRPDPGPTGGKSWHEHPALRQKAGRATSPPKAIQGRRSGWQEGKASRSGAPFLPVCVASGFAVSVFFRPSAFNQGDAGRGAVAILQFQGHADKFVVSRFDYPQIQAFNDGDLGPQKG